ncbi:hypothetical protein ACS0TY_013212 [Phlomoides rotata]
MMGSGKMEAAGPSSGRGEEKKQEEMMEEEENEEEEKGPFGNFVPGPLLPLKEQIEKDKEDESLRRWKEKLLGCLESDLNGSSQAFIVILFNSCCSFSRSASNFVMQGKLSLKLSFIQSESYPRILMKLVPPFPLMDTKASKYYLPCKRALSIALS